MAKVILIETGTSYQDDVRNVTLFADVDDPSELTNDDIAEAYPIDKIKGGSVIYTRALANVGTFRDDQQGVDSIDWGDE